MADNQSRAPTHAVRFDLVGLLLQVTLVISVFCTVLSGLLLAGLAFGAAFRYTFAVENGLEQPIWITPVGTVDQKGSRRPLPVCYDYFVAIRSSVRGGYELQPSETVTITYDMDDIIFSEIVVEDASGVVGELVVNANPTINRSQPESNHFVVKQDSLTPVPPPVLNAAENAKQKSRAASVMLSMLVIPWPMALLFFWLNTKYSSRVGTQRDFSEPSDAEER